ncbi:hypothetical protein DRN73_09910 [Candidatus Pacearchaeota archaeon]|nr:MAG: hypothetical protein DRN73_09910 [Candidatus Pacearchaeota archaeon]
MREEAKELLEIIKEICKVWGKADLYLIYNKARKQLGMETREIKFWLKYLFDKDLIRWNDNQIEVVESGY